MTFFKFLKVSITACAFLLVSFTGFSQGFYVKFGAGYNWGVGAETFQHYSRVIPFSGPVTVTLKRAAFNYGKGGSFNAAAGYMFTENLGAELAAGYLIGVTHTAESDDYYSNNGVHVSRIHEFSARIVVLKPSFIISAGTGTIKPYAKAGLIAAFGTLTENQKDNNYNLPAIERKYEYTGGFGFGFHGAAGINFTATDHLDLYTELAFNNLTYAPEKGSLTKYTEGNVNAMHTRQRYDREIEFTENYQFQFNAGTGEVIIDENAPEKRLKQDLPFSTVGFEIGAKYNF